MILKYAFKVDIHSISSFKLFLEAQIYVIKFCFNFFVLKIKRRSLHDEATN